jgi:polysaccharide deacetylase family protein (PEP-CTERM system associated)
MNILTFDIEDWFHISFDEGFNDISKINSFESRIENNMNRILELLKDKNQKGTFFCLGWVAERFPNVIKQIDAAGHEIGSHTNMHHLVTQHTKASFDEDLKKSIDLLSSITNKKVKYFRAPAFSIGHKNKWAFEVLHDNKIEIDCSIFPSNRDFGGFEGFNNGEPCIVNYNEINLKELPINLQSFLGKKIVFSGGGYFRLFPYFLIKKWLEKSNYTMTYFHPRDFDPGQPILSNLSTLRRVKSYYGLKNSFSKFTKMLDEFEFCDVNEANKLINWENVTRVKI